jgi:hypothetical protein
LERNELEKKRKMIESMSKNPVISAPPRDPSHNQPPNPDNIAYDSKIFF